MRLENLMYIKLNNGEGNGNSPQYSCLENPMDSGAWQAAIHGITRVRHDLATKSPNLIIWRKAVC